MVIVGNQNKQTRAAYTDRQTHTQKQNCLLQSRPGQWPGPGENQDKMHIPMHSLDQLDSLDSQ